MNTDPRSALAALITALERHYEAAAASRDDDDPALDAATDQLATAFDAYDDALFDAFDIATPLIVFDEDDDDDDEDFDDLDRKSTRLNSSHVAISYAVFCLKKKKRNNR